MSSSSSGAGGGGGARSASHCYLDFDMNDHRDRLGRAAAFVDATDSRYGFSSPDLRLLGGSELSRVPELVSTDHEWSSNADVEVRPPPCGNRVVVRLYRDETPLTCENFATLCSNGGMASLPPPRDASVAPDETAAKKKPPSIRPAPVGDSGKPLSYRKSAVHRVIPGFIVQGGDFVFGNGSGGESVFGKKFKDERPGLNLRHDKPGVLSMGNSGKNSNTSQFFFTLAPAPQCDGKHVVFGEVVSGWPVLRMIESAGTPGGNPDVPVTITDCGLWGPLMQVPGGGYWYDKPDGDSYTGISPVFMVQPRVAVVAPTPVVSDKFRKVLGSCCPDFTSVAVDDGGVDAAVRRVCELLETYAVDVVLVAPACSRDVLPKLHRLPPSWTAFLEEHSLPKIPLDEVVMESKPVEALSAVRTKSWMAKRTNWQLDGMI